MPHKDPQTGMGNHIHVILDNQPYEAYYDLDQPFELRNVAEGKHTLRVFPSRPWHESYKNEGAFQMVTFTVKGGGDPSKPTTTNTGQVMAPAQQSGSERQSLARSRRQRRRRKHGRRCRSHQTAADLQPAERRIRRRRRRSNHDRFLVD